MRIERRWFLGITVLLLPLLTSSIAKGDKEETQAGLNCTGIG